MYHVMSAAALCEVLDSVTEFTRERIFLSMWDVNPLGRETDGVYQRYWSKSGIAAGMIERGWSTEWYSVRGNCYVSSCVPITAPPVPDIPVPKLDISMLVPDTLGAPVVRGAE